MPCALLDYASLLDKELRQRHGELNCNSRHHEQARISPARLIGSVRECWSSGGLILNGAKVQRKFLFAATASSEFFATDLVVSAMALNFNGFLRRSDRLRDSVYLSEFDCAINGDRAFGHTSHGVAYEILHLGQFLVTGVHIQFPIAHLALVDTGPALAPF